MPWGTLGAGHTCAALADLDSPTSSPPYKRPKQVVPDTVLSTSTVSHPEAPEVSLHPVPCIINDAFQLGTDPAFVPAEALAQQLLSKAGLEHSEILELWSRIPMCKRLKPPQAQALGQSYLVLGLSPRLPEHFTTPSYPLQRTVRVLAKFVKQHFPDLRYTTLSFQTNCNKGPHRDLNNADAPAFLTCLSQQPGGELWIHTTQGSHPMNHAGQILYGVVAPIKQSPILFQSRAQIHCCTPWRSGPRTTLTALTTLNIKSAPDSLRYTALKHLDLPFPTAEDLAAWSLQAKTKAKRERAPKNQPDPHQNSILDFVRSQQTGPPNIHE